MLDDDSGWGGEPLQEVRTMTVILGLTDKIWVNEQSFYGNYSRSGRRTKAYETWTTTEKPGRQSFSCSGIPLTEYKTRLGRRPWIRPTEVQGDDCHTWSTEL